VGFIGSFLDTNTDIAREKSRKRFAEQRFPWQRLYLLGVSKRDKVIHVGFGNLPDDVEAAEKTLARKAVKTAHKTKNSEALRVFIGREPLPDPPVRARREPESQRAAADHKPRHPGRVGRGAMEEFQKLATTDNLWRSRKEADLPACEIGLKATRNLSRQASGA